MTNRIILREFLITWKTSTKGFSQWFLYTLVISIFLCPFVHAEKIPPSSNELTKHSFSAPHMGTVVRLVFYTEQKSRAIKLARDCFQRVKKLDAVFSDYRPDSEVTQLCQKPVGVAHRVSSDLFTVISHAQLISTKSEGAFDITLGKQTQEWRKDSQKGAITPNKRSPQNVQSTGYLDLAINDDQRTITLRKPLKIDLGGIAKGYIADQLMLILKKAGINHAAVVIGGETVLADAPPGKKGWRIGIENSKHQVLGTLVLTNTALSTSGDSYQFFEVEGQRHSHLIDPATKKSKLNRLNVTTIAKTAMQADAWATALRILSTDNALKLANNEPNLEALFAPHEKNRLKTINFPKMEEE
jgi:thiamine biosynthesis lipoprotein